jgi:AcrR family transcriptional regulator
VFSELGYRRATTAELAERCGVRENILYRLWPNKKAMFLAAIDHIFQYRLETWSKISADQLTPQETVDRLISYEAKHQGEFGFYRIVFSALSENDDEQIRSALTRMYRQFHQLLCRRVDAGREDGCERELLREDEAAWGLMGVATMSSIIRELGLLRTRHREQMFASVAKYVVRGRPSVERSDTPPF